MSKNHEKNRKSDVILQTDHFEEVDRIFLEKTSEINCLNNQYNIYK